MKLFKNTYYFFSVLTLLLFLSSVVLPVSVSAATLFCDMEMEEMAQMHSMDNDACCDLHDLSSETEKSFTSTNSSCGYQEVCAEAVSSDQIEKKAIPQFTKSFIVALVFSDIFVGDTEKSVRQKIGPEAIKPPKNEPIFLLNSAFLN